MYFTRDPDSQARVDRVIFDPDQLCFDGITHIVFDVRFQRMAVTGNISAGILGDTSIGNVVAKDFYSGWPSTLMLEIQAAAQQFAVKRQIQSAIHKSDDNSRLKRKQRHR